jgi:hypothetical protein
LVGWTGLYTRRALRIVVVTDDANGPSARTNLFEPRPREGFVFSGDGGVGFDGAVRPTWRNTVCGFVLVQIGLVINHGPTDAPKGHATCAASAAILIQEGY